MKLLSRFQSLFRLAHNHRRMLVVSGACAILAGWLGLVPFGIVALIGREALETGLRKDRILPLVLTATGVLVLRYVLIGISKLLSHVAAFRTMYDLQLALAKKVGAMPLGTVTGRGASTIKKTILQDTDIAHTIIGHYIANILTGIAVPLATIIVFVCVDWRMALAAMAVLPFLYLAHRGSFRNFAGELEAYFRADEKMQSGITEYVNGISVIKTYNRDLSGSLRAAVADQVSHSIGWAERTMLSWSAFNILSDISLLFILPVGLFLTMDRIVSPATLLFFLLLGIGYLQPLVRLSVQIGFLNRAGKSLERIESILDAAVVAQPANAQVPADNGIILDRVTFAHNPGEPVVKDVSLSIPEGTICAFVGPSGAGKSTLAQLIGRFWDVESGAIRIGGVDLRDMTEDELYRRVTFVFQDVFLFQGSVADNLRLARPDATDQEIIAACRAARAHDFIMQMPQGYASQVGDKGGLLSGGQKQRLSIARALLRDSPILILDEATAYADPINEAEIQKALKILMKGRTVIMIAHRLSTIVHADQIAVLDKGQLAAAANHVTLLKTSPLYSSLWRDYSQSAAWHFETPDQFIPLEAAS